MFTVEIDTDNDAFHNGCATAEVSRILRKLAEHLDRFDSLPAHVIVADVNGNRCGIAKFVGVQDRAPEDEAEDDQDDEQNLDITLPDSDLSEEDQDEDEDEDNQDDDDPGVTCPACHGPTTSLGVLGDRWHLSCRDCGAEFSREV